MAETGAPVAIRVTRPYAAEDELLENELDTFTRTSITLLGAQPRPAGLVLRFELLLSSGQVLVRGEGRVVGYRPDAYYGLGGLTLRFTRLDTRSKAFIDKVAATRERRRPSTKLAPVEAPSSPVAPAEAPSSPALPVNLEDVLEISVPSPAAPQAPEEPRAPAAPPPGPDVLSPPPVATPASDASPVDRVPNSAVLALIPADRDALLARLRQRSKALSEEAVRTILARGR